MTDDTAALKNALLSMARYEAIVMPIPCPQALWKWLWAPNHGVPKEDRKFLMNEFCKIVYTKTEQEAEDIFSCLVEDCKHFKFVKHISKLFERNVKMSGVWHTE